MKYLILLLLALPVHAKNIGVASHEDVRVYLTDEPCEISVVINLPYKAVWKDTKGQHEGCWGPFGQNVGLYFEDKTVAVIPVYHFKSVQEI